ncbi:hypothetical protein HPP92_023075 [Vanilla planifolia]|uniref:Lipid droplet-associated hydrolase n=1 Tax=Vanilla planifolia TaxID=51239 RepID=A0A835PS33_VANPL|nr:hypothetical protein HPP92_023075 [Vanilla planifolia]
MPPIPAVTHSNSPVRFCTRLHRLILRSFWYSSMKITAENKDWSMSEDKFPFFSRKQATARKCLVSGFSTELLEVIPEEPSLNVLLIPGNPGVISFYKEFVEALYENLGGYASITAIGHISHSRQDTANGRLFSFQEQINHKVDFIKQGLRNNHLPIILVGHSIGSYISMEIFKRFPDQVAFAIFLYPFLSLNPRSLRQCMIGVVARSYFLSTITSCLVALLGSFPATFLSTLVRRFLGQSWSATAVDSACNCLMKYHTVCNALFMARAEFEKLSEEPDWSFMRENVKKIAFLFGTDDHWGPLSFFEEISRRVPGAELSIERAGHTHAFSCTEAGSIWVANYVATLIKNQVPN